MTITASKGARKYVAPPPLILSKEQRGAAEMDGFGVSQVPSPRHLVTPRLSCKAQGNVFGGPASSLSRLLKCLREPHLPFDVPPQWAPPMGEEAFMGNRTVQMVVCLPLWEACHTSAGGFLLKSRRGMEEGAPKWLRAHLL